jgi:hypothetical protein
MTRHYKDGSAFCQKPEKQGDNRTGEKLYACQILSIAKPL